MAFDKQHVHIKRILVWFDQYRAGTLDIEGLQQNLAVIEGAIEGDVPAGTRIRIDTVHEMLELIRFGWEDPDDVERVMCALECQIDIDIRSVNGERCNCAAPDWDRLWEDLGPRKA